MGVPRVGSLPEGLEIVSLTREEAQDALIGKTLGKSVPNTKIPDVISDFDPNSGMDDDALYYASVAPDYDEHNLNADGEAKTREQRREEADYTIMEELQGGQEEERMEQDPVQHEGEAAFATSALQMSLVEPANAGPAQLSTPNSAATSMPSSEAVSATSSNSNAAVPQTRRSTVAA